MTSAPSPGADDRTRQIEDLYREDYPRVVGFLMKQGASAQDAAECAQEAFVELCRDFEKINHPRAYIRKIAENTWRRSDKRNKSQVQNAIKANWAGSLAGEDVYAREEVQTVLRALLTLPDAQRRVMAWHFDGYTPAEIAEELGMKILTVRSNLRHARKKLTEKLTDFEFDGCEEG